MVISTAQGLPTKLVCLDRLPADWCIVSTVGVIPVIWRQRRGSLRSDALISDPLRSRRVFRQAQYHHMGALYVIGFGEWGGRGAWWFLVSP